MAIQERPLVKTADIYLYPEKLVTEANAGAGSGMIRRRETTSMRALTGLFAEYHDLIRPLTLGG